MVGVASEESRLQVSGLGLEFSCAGFYHYLWLGGGAF